MQSSQFTISLYFGSHSTPCCCSHPSPVLHGQWCVQYCHQQNCTAKKCNEKKYIYPHLLMSKLKIRGFDIRYITIHKPCDVSFERPYIYYQTEMCSFSIWGSLFLFECLLCKVWKCVVRDLFHQESHNSSTSFCCCVNIYCNYIFLKCVDGKFKRLQGFLCVLVMNFFI